MPYVTRVRVINKQSAKVLGMCDTDSELDRVIREKVIIVFSMETPCWSPSDGLQRGGRKPVETSGVYFGYLKIKRFFSLLNLKHSHRHLSQHIGYSELENIRRIDIFVHVICYSETMPMSLIVKKRVPARSIFKTKRTTELKTDQQIYV